MKHYYGSPILNRARGRLARLYGPAAAGRLMPRLAMMIGRYGIGAASRPALRPIDHSSAMLIAYPDSVREPPAAPLAALKRFLDARARGAFSHLHVLPFFPSSSDDGFSVVHFREVAPAFGGWQHIRELGKDRDLVFDLVLNHVSRESGWFHDFVAGVAPGRDYFIEADPAVRRASVVRPRSSPLLAPVMTWSGPKHVWTTFSADQIDLNYADSDVLFEMLDIALFYIAMGARVLRLDAVAYLWKKEGTACLNLPETHEIVRLLRDLLALCAQDVRLLTETNLPHHENVSYFSSGEEAHWVYQFSLPPLLLNALLAGNARYLAEWAGALAPPPPGCAFLNITGTHDGIGVRPLEGLVPPDEIEALSARLKASGGRVSTRRAADGADVPYELNSTWFDALGGLPGDTPELHMRRFLCSQALLMSFKGIPAVYFNTLLAARNDTQLAALTGMNRSLNRGKQSLADLNALLDDPHSGAARSLAAHLRLLKARSEHPAFHPDGSQKVSAPARAVLAIERESPDGAERVLVLANLGGRPAAIAEDALAARGWQERGDADLLTGAPVRAAGGLQLEPYSALWLKLP